MAPPPPTPRKAAEFDCFGLARASLHAPAEEAKAMARTKFKMVWGALDRQGKTFWTRIGLAWETRNGDVYATLSAVPLNGKICITASVNEPFADEMTEVILGEAAQ
jgi:hypothetical protein